VTYSFRNPFDGLSWIQRLLWPLIFMQLIALKRWVRSQYGRGVPYRIGISAFGRVRLLRLPTDAARSQSAPGARAVPGFEFSAGLVRAAFRLACADETTPRAPAPDVRRLVLACRPLPCAPCLDSS
jgi:hypothetical protein